MLQISVFSKARLSIGHGVTDNYKLLRPMAKTVGIRTWSRSWSVSFRYSSQGLVIRHVTETLVHVVFFRCMCLVLHPFPDKQRDNVASAMCMPVAVSVLFGVGLETMSISVTSGKL